MSRGHSRAERLQEMLRLYSQRAYTDIEIAERLGVDRTTAFRDRLQLETEHPFVEVEEGRYQIDKVRYVSNIKLNRSEALTLYLSARRTSQQTRIAQVSAASSLEKLATTLQQPMTARLVKAADRILHQQSDPQRTASPVPDGKRNDSTARILKHRLPADPYVDHPRARGTIRQREY